MLRRNRRTEPGAWKVRSERPRVLIENHDPAVGHSLQRFLVDEGYEVAYCSGPGDREGRCPLVHDGICNRAAEAAVVFTSLHITDEDHREVVASLKRHFPDTPLVVELPAPKVAQYGALLEGCEVVAKPVTRDALLMALRRVLSLAD